MVWYGRVGLLWYGMVWYGRVTMVWYGMVGLVCVLWFTQGQSAVLGCSSLYSDTGWGQVGVGDKAGPWVCWSMGLQFHGFASPWVCRFAGPCFSRSNVLGTGKLYECRWSGPESIHASMRRGECPIGNGLPIYNDKFVYPFLNVLYKFSLFLCFFLHLRLPWLWIRPAFIF